MSDTTISPNMNMPIPVVGTDSGPDWANNLNASLNIVDSHNHTSGQGVQITPSGVNINIDMPFNGNNAISLRTTRYNSQGAVLTQASDLECLYVVGVDLYYNDGSGNNIRITQGGAVAGATGTITGLPSGTASAAYSTGTFTFQKATSTPATMNIGSVIISQENATPNGVTLQASNSLASNYSLTLPAAAPSANQTIVSDSSGNLSFVNIGSTVSSGSIGTGINVGNWTSLGSITLTAGKWIIVATTTYSGNSGISYYQSFISTASNSGTGAILGLNSGIGLVAANGVGNAVTLYLFVNVGGSTTYYLNCQTNSLSSAGLGGVLGSLVGMLTTS